MSKGVKQKNHSFAKRGILVGLLFLAISSFAAVLVPAPAYAIQSPMAKAPYQCGSGKNTVKTSINIGCKGASCTTSNKDGCSALLDATFAIIRFLSAGVGIIVIGSIIWAGIQYASARDDPGATNKAKERIYNSMYALIIFIFSYAILNYLIPAGFFK
ncbi:MAG TPA: hypothetical protein VLH86_01470 [Patescibacteria group bacterium]|nr:hypothetical protein [Patescibacteria group bacterium]